MGLCQGWVFPAATGGGDGQLDSQEAASSDYRGLSQGTDQALLAPHPRQDKPALESAVWGHGPTLGLYNPSSTATSSTSPDGKKPICCHSSLTHTASLVIHLLEASGTCRIIRTVNHKVIPVPERRRLKTLKANEGA